MGKSIYYDGERIIGGESSNSGINFTTDETLNLTEDNVLGVSTPVNGIISQGNFDALPSEKQNHGMWIIEGNDQPLQGVVIEEYDSTVDGCDWHVRKWSNGYVEMMGTMKRTNIETTTVSGAFYITGTGIDGPKFPFPLTVKYGEQDKVVMLNSSGSSVFTYSYLLKESELLTNAYGMFPARPKETTGATMIFTYYVTGRWK